MFNSADFADAGRAARNLLLGVVVVVVIIIGALVNRLNVQARNEWIARCIIANVDYRPHEGLRTYCENLYSDTH